jgi:hypothetical protein
VERRVQRRRAETTTEEEDATDGAAVAVVEDEDGEERPLLFHPPARGRMPTAAARDAATPRADDVAEEEGARRPMDPGDQRALAADGTHIDAVIGLRVFPFVCEESAFCFGYLSAHEKHASE